ncbi:glucose-1-phosphate adenylyltransferase [Candidatus Venteria ishoeyi]|uniref:Glucose-1-phosphate adenylyltransferase n=1 Tax=Candidatus Venteria ishoeyi TaxID=1899563 RepID=A0A1H6FEC4_9GAMM|nr:glucose-1-phosphate adenylyltransferase [Candidatus Venteria ishoeyi]MDM8547311.1 glucose-1-phosphate adenylyltransferase [Candidatus Venteria ishoeyi]SEH07375.1 Glucose-1-phosphate adenylyltransferase [Candidatus Venteria ishoeyi]
MEQPSKQEENARFISRLTKKTLALILAGGRGSRLKNLTDWRAKPAVPFAGKFRIIDFPLSNCINSNIRQVSVLTQYKAHSLILHIQKGWSFLRGESGEFVELIPAQQRLSGKWYQGTADAVHENLDIIRHHAPEYVLVLAGDHIYKMDYGPMLAAHASSEADLTVGCIDVSLEEARGFGVMSTDENQRITAFNEKPENPQPLVDDPNKALASMGIYIFNTKFLLEQLRKDASNKSSSHDFGHDIIPSIIDDYRVFAYPFNKQREGDILKDRYWRDVGTIDAFWEANHELVGVTPPLNLYDKVWPIWTYQEQLPPAKFIFDDDDRRGMAVDSMVSGGCIISGAKITRSLLFSNVHLHSGSILKDTVVLPDVDIAENCRISKAVIDKGCAIPEGMSIGQDPEEDKKNGFYISERGVVLVTPEMLKQNIHHSR